MNHFPTFNFNEVINLIEDSFCKETNHWTNTCIWYIIPLAKIKSIVVTLCYIICYALISLESHDKITTQFSKNRKLRKRTSDTWGWHWDVSAKNMGSNKTI